MNAQLNMLQDHAHLLALLDQATLAVAAGNAHTMELLAAALAIDLRLHCQVTAAAGHCVGYRPAPAWPGVVVWRAMVLPLGLPASPAAGACELPALQVCAGCCCAGKSAVESIPRSMLLPCKQAAADVLLPALEARGGQVPALAAEARAVQAVLEADILEASCDKLS